MLRVLKKGWPQFLVASSGVALYVCAHLYLDTHEALVSGIAVNLVSIPIIFMLYEYWLAFNHRKLNKSVYKFAQNKVQVSIVAVHSKLELLVDGAFTYFEKGSILIDDSDIENIRITQHQHDELHDDRLLNFERINVFENLTDARYLEFQLADLTLAEELEHLEKLLANAFIMQRLEDEQVRAIIFLIETISMLEAFFNNQEYVFCKTSINLHGFSIEKINEQPSLSALVFREKSVDEPVMLDIKPARMIELSESPLPAYVISQDYYNILSDLIFDVIDAINQWKAVSDPIFIDYENAQISVL